MYPTFAPALLDGCPDGAPPRPLLSLAASGIGPASHFIGAPRLAVRTLPSRCWTQTARAVVTRGDGPFSLRPAPRVRRQVCILTELCRHETPRRSERLSTVQLEQDDGAAGHGGHCKGGHEHHEEPLFAVIRHAVSKSSQKNSHPATQAGKPRTKHSAVFSPVSESAIGATTGISRRLSRAGPRSGMACDPPVCSGPPPVSLWRAHRGPYRSQLPPWRSSRAMFQPPLHFAMQIVRRHRLTWPRLCAHWRCRTPWRLKEAAPGGMGARLLP